MAGDLKNEFSEIKGFLEQNINRRLVFFGENMTYSVSLETIQEKILYIRGVKVLLDHDLAQMYGIENKQLKRSVRRNRKRFPPDFMLELTKEAYNSLRSQFGTLKRGEHSKYMPMSFTEQGVAMLSSVLNSEKAVEVNILIMLAFVKIREMAAAHKDLLLKINEMENKYDHQFRVVFEASKSLMEEEEKPKRKIGFEVNEGGIKYRSEKRS